MGVSQDTFLVEAFKQARTLRLADGPDEVVRFPFTPTARG